MQGDNKLYYVCLRNGRAFLGNVETVEFDDFVEGNSAFLEISNPALITVGSKGQIEMALLDKSGFEPVEWIHIDLIAEIRILTKSHPWIKVYDQMKSGIIQPSNRDLDKLSKGNPFEAN